MKKALLFTFAFIPFIASAFAFPNLRSFSTELVSVLDIVLNIAITIAFIAFFWGVAKFILHASNEKEITSGKEFMMYGVFALFALISFKAIIIFFSGQFEFGDPQDPKKFLPETVEYNV
ncbi:MAG: hypothetical protein RL292_471 [Candidatus Parcubacteria bacterium]|jgi:hypothetical protein